MWILKYRKSLRTYILQNQKPKHRFSAPFAAVSPISLFLEDFCLDNNNNNNNNNSNNNININTSVQKLLLDAVERNADVNMGWLARGKSCLELILQVDNEGFGSYLFFSFLFCVWIPNRFDFHPAFSFLGIFKCVFQKLMFF